jgi:hypothetical protein
MCDKVAPCNYEAEAGAPKSFLDILGGKDGENDKHTN